MCERVMRFFRVGEQLRQQYMQTSVSMAQRAHACEEQRAAQRSADRDARERAFSEAVRSRARDRRARRARVEAIAAADMGGRGAANDART